MQDVPGCISPVAPKRMSWGPGVWPPGSPCSHLREVMSAPRGALREVQAAAPSGRSEENTPTRKLRPRGPALHEAPPRGCLKGVVLARLTIAGQLR